MGGPGKTAPLLLQNLLTYDPRYEGAAGRNLLTSPPPHHDPRAAPTSSVPYRNCRHDVHLKEEQSALPQRGIAPDENTIYKVAVYCRKCRWHFDIWVDFRDDGPQNVPCKKSDPEFPLHHFIFSGEDDPIRSESLGDSDGSRLYTFYCSAPKCPVALRIRISPPCLSDDDLILLTDPANLRKRWERSKEINGDRADTDMAQSIDAPNFLNTYLHDSFNPTKGKTRIPLLNRKFLKTFGRDCDHILEKLGFTFAVEVDADGNSTDGWYLPRPSEAQNPLENLKPTPRNLIENARFELNAIILRYPESERSTARRNPLTLIPARSYIELAFGCDDYELREGGRRETRSTSREEDHPYYAGLGALADFADSLLIFAYNRQVEADAVNTSYYFECLKDLAKGRNSEILLTESAILESQGLFTRQDVIQAYRTLGIDPSHASALSDEIITNQFKSRLADIGPRQVEEARSALQVIGTARNSEIIKRAASNSIETYEEALAWLNLPDSVDLSGDDFVITMYTSKVNDSPQETEIGRKAVKIIADYRKSQRLWQWLETGQMDAAEMDTAEAYATLSITDRSSRLDPSVLQTLYEGMLQDAPENAQRLETALAKVRQDQQNSHGTSYLDTTQQPAHNYELDEWPVGCCNIGNTCYLNSVLQFLFTIKPLRDMVIDCDTHFQDLSPEALEPKRVGRTAVSRARAETGQQFVRELQALFKHMITANTHNIRPERSLAALALTRGENTDIASEAPTRAPSRLGKIGDMPVSGPMLPPGFSTTSMPPSPADSVMGDAEGDADSMKAMDLTATADKPSNTAASQPEPPSRPPPVPPRPQASADIGLKKLEDVAQQQDAAEILNNVFDLLSCAFKGEDVLQDGEQLDLIKKTFFSNVTTVRKTKDKDIPKSDLQDNVLVSTKGRDRSICAALDDEFGLTELEGGVTKYEFFENAAPIQIINVRRLQFENGRARKDESHLALDKVLYLDRYLKSTRSLSEEQLQELRNQQWRLQAELRTLETRKKLLNETEFKDVDLAGVLDETASLVTKLEEQLPDSHSNSEPQQSLQESSSSSPASSRPLTDQLNQRADELRPELSEIHERMDKLETHIDSVFKDCQDHPYRLHAIFMHAGSSSGGHYWIYIYDFQHDIWRKYNDETVTLESEETILKRVQQDRPPTSTGIVYVRDDVAIEYTEAVHRKPNKGTDAQDGETTQRGDIEMTDAMSANVVNMDDFTNMEVIHGQEL
ncbi:ubiquitin-specific protease ubp2 [Paraconiothyrium brasiliense]|uniref:ubiquitinyl hydrolase 1 n=1 Tax=Paraconiothyrium brasiliense TaxID=300254 RepID=A0ABR3RE11_9PLEO